MTAENAEIKLFESISNTIDIDLWVHNVETDNVFITPRVATRLGVGQQHFSSLSDFVDSVRINISAEELSSTLHHCTREEMKVFTFKVKGIDEKIGDGWIQITGRFSDQQYGEGRLCVGRCVEEHLIANSPLLTSEVLNALPCYLFAKDSLRRFTYVNDPLCEVIGLCREEIIGKTDEEVLSVSSETEHFRITDEQVISGKEEVVVESESLTTTSGSTIKLQTRKVPISLNQPGDYGVLGVSTDITELITEKRFLEKLISSLGDSGDGVVISDASGEVVRSNNAITKISQLMSATSDELLDEITKQGVNQLLNQHDNEEHILEMNIESARRWFLVKQHELLEEDGVGGSGAVMILRDITKIKTAEAESNRYKHLLQSVLDRIPQVISLKDKDGKYVIVNAAAARMIGCSHRENMIGRTDFELCDTCSGMTPETAKNWREIESGVISQEITVTTEETIGNGEFRIFVYRVPFHDADGDCVGILTISGS